MEDSPGHARVAGPDSPGLSELTVAASPPVAQPCASALSRPRGFQPLRADPKTLATADQPRAGVGEPGTASLRDGPSAELLPAALSPGKRHVRRKNQSALRP